MRNDERRFTNRLPCLPPVGSVVLPPGLKESKNWMNLKKIRGFGHI